MKDIPKLSEMEIAIMAILWRQDKDITIQEISDAMGEKNVSPSSVSQAMKRLLKKNVVSVRNHLQVSNVYARTFAPDITREEFICAELMRLVERLFENEQSCLSAIVTLLESVAVEEMDGQGLQAIQDVIDRKRKKIET